MREKSCKKEQNEEEGVRQEVVESTLGLCKNPLLCWYVSQQSTLTSRCLLFVVAPRTEFPGWFQKMSACLRLLALATPPGERRFNRDSRGDGYTLRCDYLNGDGVWHSPNGRRVQTSICHVWHPAAQHLRISAALQLVPQLQLTCRVTQNDVTLHCERTKKLRFYLKNDWAAYSLNRNQNIDHISLVSRIHRRLWLNVVHVIAY